MLHITNITTINTQLYTIHSITAHPISTRPSLHHTLSLHTTSPPAQKAQHERSKESRKREPDERRICLGLATSGHTIRIQINMAILVLATVDNDIIDQVRAARLRLVARAGVDSKFGSHALKIRESATALFSLLQFHTVMT